MKTMILSALAILSFLGQGALAQSLNQTVYYYRLDIQNATDRFNGEWISDLSSIRTAEALQQAQPGACIDLQLLGTGGIRAAIGIVANSELDTRTLYYIKQSICEDSSSNCAVQVTKNAYPLSDLTIDTFAQTTSPYKPKPVRYSLKGKPMLPQFSAACQTGRYDDSWRKNVSTKAARAYVKALGIDLQNVRTLELGHKKSGSIYNFGFPLR